MNKNKNVWESHNVAKRAQTGAKLYLKVHKARIQKDITPTSETLAIVLVGEELVWHGTHETDKRFHKVSFTIMHSRVQHNPPVGATDRSIRAVPNAVVLARPDGEIVWPPSVGAAAPPIQNARNDVKAAWFSVRVPYVQTASAYCSSTVIGLPGVPLTRVRGV